MSELPQGYRQFTQEFPQVAEAYGLLGAAAHEGGPLDGKTRALVKLALAVGARQEGAVHSHVRRALEIGITPQEIKHVVLLAITSLGFSSAVAAYTWVIDEVSRSEEKG